MSKNSGRSTTGGPKVPYYSESDEREAVKHLRLTCTRFLTGHASRKDIDEAINIWKEFLQRPAEEKS